MSNKIIFERIMTANKELDLSNLDINSVPETIFKEPYYEKLMAITHINLSNNNLTDLPVQFSNIKDLVFLNISGNAFESVPKCVFSLEGLNYLYIRNNVLNSLSNEVDSLRVLKYLDLSMNKLKELPMVLYNLRFLRNLNISSNKIKELDSKLGDLTFLVDLDIRNTEIDFLPPSIEYLINLTELRFSEYKINNVPLEILSRGARSIVNYFQALKDQIQIFESKLIIVGEGGVGKTSLINKIIYNEFDESEDTTEGIAITNCHLITGKTDKFRVNFWDFGGQEIYHATHQFFLTKRSLYLLVWNARNDDHRFDYWLNVINLLSDNAPVIIVQNKIDERIKMIDEFALHNRFNNIIGFHKVSSKNGEGIDDLKNEISSAIDSLPHIGDRLPKVWVEIRSILENYDKDFIEYEQDYLAICSKYNLSQDQANFLSQYFHDLGVFLHFQDNPILKDILFIKPEWATSAVYKVFDNKFVQRNYGRFNFNHLSEIWNDYPSNKYFHLLELMKKFELCFEIQDTKEYIIPNLLNAQSPKIDWDYFNNLNYEYSYDFMPSGLLPRFIVRVNDLILGTNYWKKGVIITRNNAVAKIVADEYSKKIKIWVNDLDQLKSVGKEKEEKGQKEKKIELVTTNKILLLEIIKREIDYIHKTLNDPDHKILLPCICKECLNKPQGKYYHEFNMLQKAKEKKKNVECKISFDDVNLNKLMLGFNFLKPKDKEKSNDVKLKAKHVTLYSKNTILRQISSKSFSSSVGMAKEDFEELKNKLLLLDEGNLEELRKLILNSEIDENQETNNEVLNFLMNCGISINQSIAASMLYDTLKYLF